MKKIIFFVLLCAVSYTIEEIGSAYYNTLVVERIFQAKLAPVMTSAKQASLELYGPEPTDDNMVNLLKHMKLHRQVEEEAGYVVTFALSRACEEENFEFAMAAALAKTENEEFDPEAISKKGAKGLIQIMPKTYAELGGKNWKDPDENALLGIRYFKKLLKRYNGDLDLALAGYNAGMGKVKKHNGIPPYRETRDYIEKFKKFYKYYKSLTT